MKAMKKSAIILCTGAVLFFMAGNVGATVYQGMIAPNNGMIATMDWFPNASLGWKVDDEKNPGYWTYVYNWTSASKNLSHIDIEVSPTFTKDDLIIWDTNKNFAIESTIPTTISEIDTFSIFGLKWKADEETTILTLTLLSTRAPMWGDFFAKDGKDSLFLQDIYAYNTGFGYNTFDPIGNGNNMKDIGGAVTHAWILVPDTKTSPSAVPEPATMILLSSSLVGLAGFSRKFRKS